MAERKQVDWEGVERDYSAGIKSLREIGGIYGVDEAYIRRKAKANGWCRDLSKKIQDKADNLVRKEQVRTEKAITEKEVIEANAHAIVSVKLSHRKDIVRVKSVVNTLLEEIEELSEAKSADNLPVRVDMTKKLMDTLKVAIDKERQAFDIQDKTSPVDDALSDLVKTVQKNSLFVVKNNQVEDLDDD